MARKIVVTCDGCGREEEAGDGPPDAADEAVMVEAALPLLGPGTYSVGVRPWSTGRPIDLCGGCRRAVCAQVPPARRGARPVCAGCGSARVRAIAQVMWDEGAQDWVKDPDGDRWESWCDDCGDGDELKEEEIADG
jgi:hypothetical protein